jgi:hypothetical protein
MCADAAADADWVIRLVGNNGKPMERVRLDERVERFKQWSDQGLQLLWFCMHQHDELFASSSSI